MPMIARLACSALLLGCGGQLLGDGPSDANAHRDDGSVDTSPATAPADSPSATTASDPSDSEVEDGAADGLGAPCVGEHNDGFGDAFTDDVCQGDYTLRLAMDACLALAADNPQVSGHQVECVSEPSSASCWGELFVVARDTTGACFGWDYSGQYQGHTIVGASGCNGCLWDNGPVWR